MLVVCSRNLVTIRMITSFVSIVKECCISFGVLTDISNRGIFKHPNAIFISTNIYGINCTNIHNK